MSALYSFLGKVITQIINPIIMLLATAAFVMFVWGVFQFILHAGSETERKEGKQAIVWGIVGLVVIFGAYGIINLAILTTNITPNGQTTIQGVLKPAK
jgi:TRAP-type C4-dicarboxylate transport system permease small subunit